MNLIITINNIKHVDQLFYGFLWFLVSGLKLEPGIKYNLSIKANVCLANVALDPSTVEKLPSSEEKCDEEFGEECEAGRQHTQDGLQCLQMN